MVENNKTYLPYWLEISAVALLYIITAKVGHVFAVHPGNITPVWLPSGIMLALVLIRGYHIWPGIFLGAFMGNVSAYIDPSSISNPLKYIMAGTANGLGDVLATVGTAYILKKIKAGSDLLDNFKSLLSFLLLGAFFGPLVSAIFGVTGLALTGLVSWDAYVYSLTTWWVGDGVGVLLLTPLILLFHREKGANFLAGRLAEFSAYTLIFSSVCLFMWFDVYWPELLPAPIFFTIPLLLWAVLRFDLRVAFLSIVVTASISTILASQQLGPFVHQSQLRSIIELQLYLSIIITSILAVGVVSAQRDRLFEQLKTKYNQDLLTGTWTRDWFSDAFDSEAQRYSRYGSNFCLIMFDVDYFKKINDTFGHEAGDEVLISLCEIINDELRDTDSLTRWGGEEFLVLLPNTLLEGGHQIAERCRERVAKHQFNIKRQVTISLGLTQSTKEVVMKDMLKKVDDAMYTSKQNGRNQTTVLN